MRRTVRHRTTMQQQSSGFSNAMSLSSFLHTGSRWGLSKFPPCLIAPEPM